MYVTSLACLAAAREANALSGEALFVAGHSLGEYTALAAAGAFDFEAGLRLVEERGRLTDEAAQARPGAMAALLGLDDAAVQAACDEAGAEVCNFNAPGQVVIGGDADAVDRACKLASERGARRAVKLDVSGAFHTSLMAPAAERFRQAVSSAGIRTPRVPIIANRTAAPMTDPTDIADELVYQLTHPVRWVKSVECLAANGVRSIVEFGPGRVLTGLIKRISPGMTLANINGAAAMEN
jgi:[acyl-carrier-protein] S-malonyltransferase